LPLIRNPQLELIWLLGLNLNKPYKSMITNQQVTREVTVIVGPETVVAEGQLECIVIWLEQDARADEVKVIVDDVLVGLDEAVAIIKQEHTELILSANSGNETKMLADQWLLSGRLPGMECKKPMQERECSAFR